MLRCKVALFNIVNNVMDIDECEQVYIHMSRRERFKCFRFVKFYFDYISPLNEFCDIIKFFYYGIEVIICFRLSPLPHPTQIAYFFFNTSFCLYPICICLQNLTLEQVIAFGSFLCASGYIGDFTIHSS